MPDSPDEQPVTIPNESGWMVDELIGEMGSVSRKHAVPAMGDKDPMTNARDHTSGKQSYIAHARQEMDFLQHGIGCPADSLKRIYDDLRTAGVDTSALDPDGKSSAAQMEAAIREAYKQGNLVIARRDYDHIEH